MNEKDKVKFYHSSMNGTYEQEATFIREHEGRVLLEFIDPWSEELVRKWFDKDRIIEEKKVYQAVITANENARKKTQHLREVLEQRKKEEK